MKKILCTFPGKFGDLLWALPTVRAIAETHGEPVDLLISHPFGAIRDLIEQQPYIAECAADPTWPVELGAPITPRQPPEIQRIIAEREVTRTYHLGYHGWPDRDLPSYIYEIAQRAQPMRLAPLDLDTPWITAPPGSGGPWRIAIGWSDEHFELKYGITQLVADLWADKILCGPGSRWATEAHVTPSDWVHAAQAITGSQVFLGCCSALHVLAAATGTKAVIMEPAEARHHPVFWPYGFDGRVRLVRGGDGQWTFDARHVADCVREALQCV